jgi:hypothetical protein
MLCIQHQGGSTSLLQRRLRIGYGRAARVIDQLHAAGVLGPPDGSKPRDVPVDVIGLDGSRRRIEGRPDRPVGSAAVSWEYASELAASRLQRARSPPARTPAAERPARKHCAGLLLAPISASPQASAS